MRMEGLLAGLAWPGLAEKIEEYDVKEFIAYGARKFLEAVPRPVSGIPRRSANAIVAASPRLFCFFRPGTRATRSQFEHCYERP